MASVALSTKKVGDIVKLKVDGTLRDFIVIQQGKPSSNLYDSSCDGTWLLLKDMLETRAWHSSNSNSYKASTIHSYLNNEWLNKLDANIRNQVKTVKIPYVNGTGGSAVASGANGLEAKVFLLSGYEVGFTTATNQYFPVDGVRLSYFEDGTGTSALNKRKANYNGSAAVWWLRSPNTNNATYAWFVNSYGNGGVSSCTSTYGVRPALILPSNLLTSDDGSVQTNTAPTMPGSITIPEKIEGGTTITVSWGASTDSENNLAGYKVERNLNGSATWNQIHQSNATTCQDTIPVGTQTVQYRVKAYDTENLESGWRTSEQRDVFNNNAPTAPGSITVPAEVLGGQSLAISWTAATDVDGNLKGYILERRYNDDEGWVEVKKFEDLTLTYTDTITRGKTTVQYRVCAYDDYNARSSYTESEVRQVNNNRTPTVTCDQSNGTDLGKKTEGFSITYSVNDEDADTVTVTEAIDGVTVKTHTPTLTSSNTFDVTGDTFFKLLNGAHTLTITASDGKVKVVHKLTFTKEVTEAGITLKEPFAADAKISICVLSVAGDIPADAEYTVEVTNNAKDDAPVWEDCTLEVKNNSNHVFTNETAEKGFAFNFRVTVKRGPSGKGGYINSIQGGFQ